MTPRRRWLTALVAVAGLVGLPAAAAPAEPATRQPAAAAATATVPVTRTDGVEGRMETYASQVSGAHVWDLEVIGTRIYAAGIFTDVVDAGGSWPRIDQPFLAAFDTRTGEWVQSFRPRLNRPAYALELLPSGSLAVGGEFTRANGRAAEGIVAVDPTTGATDRRFRAGVRRPGSRHPAVIRDFDRRGARLYAVGNFSRAFGGGVAPGVAQKAVRFATGTGRPDRSWKPRIAGASAYTVAVSTDGRRVHLGGGFRSVNGGRGTSQLATVSVRSGGLIRGWQHGSNAPNWPTWPVGGVVFDLDVYRNSLYLAGAEHYWERRDSRTGRSIRFERISNDGQTVEVVGDRVLVGCHCFHRDPDRQVWELDAATGRPLPGRTGALRSGDGAWATAVAADGCHWYGGDFNVATRVVGLGTGEFWVGRLARLCPSGAGAGSASAPSTDGPANLPGWRPTDG